MKNILSVLIIGLMVFAISCSKKTTTAVVDKVENTNSTPLPASGTYTINVLNPDIASPRKEMKGAIDGVGIVINYGSPYAKGRKILNGLIPFGKVWRTGANEATTFEITKDIKVEGKKLPAGKYGLFTLNNEGSCAVIFNKIHDQWGAYEYDESKDALRVIVNPSFSEASIESMDFKIINNSVLLVWEKVAIPFEIEAG